MDKKEMLEAFDQWYNPTDFRHEYDKYGPTSCANWIWQAACAWMMGKAEPVYQVQGEKLEWRDVPKISFDNYFDRKYTTRILYTAPPMQNTEREIVLPPYPRSAYGWIGNKEVMTKKDADEYARAAVELDRKNR